MLGKTNSSNGKEPAEYVFQNTKAEMAFPELPSTASTAYIFTDDNTYKDSALNFSVFESRNISTISAYFDGDKATSGNMINGLFFKFDKPVRLSKFYAYCGESSSSYSLTLKGTNNPTVQTNRDSSEWVTLYEASYTKQDFIEVNAEHEYQYYCLTKNSGYLTVYELKFYAVIGSVACTLFSNNMTPEILAFANDYMRIVTQPFYFDGVIIESRALLMKPYTDGGNLINYNDDGSAVELKMYLLTGTAATLYLLSKDDSFDLPDGYDSRLQIGMLNIPAHICKNSNGEWVMGGSELPPPITPDQ